MKHIKLFENYTPHKYNVDDYVIFREYGFYTMEPCKIINTYNSEFTAAYTGEPDYVNYYIVDCEEEFGKGICEPEIVRKMTSGEIESFNLMMTTKKFNL